MIAPRLHHASRRRDNDVAADSVRAGTAPCGRCAPHQSARLRDVRRPVPPRYEGAAWEEGRNIRFEFVWAGSRNEDVPALAQDLVARNVDLIVTFGNLGISAVQRATATIPIVGMTDDMVREGLAASMARPGGHTTGVSILGAELDLKRLELLHEYVPNARRIAALMDSTSSTATQKLIEAAASRLNLKLTNFTVRNAEEVGQALDGIAAADIGAVNVLASPMLNGVRRLIVGRLVDARLPSIYEWPETAFDGGLIGYGAPIASLYRRVAVLVDKILRGARPADLAIEQPTRFELVVNLRTAKAIGLAVAGGRRKFLRCAGAAISSVWMMRFGTFDERICPWVGLGSDLRSCDWPVHPSWRSCRRESNAIAKGRTAMNQRSIFTLSAIAMLGLALLPSGIVAQQSSLQKQLVGTWTLVSYDATAADGTRRQLSGSNAKGILIFDDGGRYASVFERAGRPKFKSASQPTTDELAAATSDFFAANFGTWSVSEADKVLTQRFEGALRPNNEGADARTSVGLAGDELKLTTINPLPTGAKIEQVYRRAK